MDKDAQKLLIDQSRRSGRTSRR
ncbi:TraY domain-containing protein [Yersinia pestis]